MVSQFQIEEVIAFQKKSLQRRVLGTEREDAHNYVLTENFANIITGIRRCGKSTLMYQLIAQNKDVSLFINFEDPRLAGFELDDFRRLDVIIERDKFTYLFFDEIQMLSNWEWYVRQKLDEGFQVMVTGSNANLLSKELGTKLTGRHLSSELFPFSYNEFLTFSKLESNIESALKYMQVGGFPEYLKTNNPLVLHHLWDDILYRDIAVRYGVRDVQTLRKLAIYLLSNIGKTYSANKLSALFQFKSVSTLLEYISHLENAYLFASVPMFSYSLKAQVRNPKKVYTIDLGLFTNLSIVFTEENGRRLENLVYLHLRRSYSQIYYFQEKYECDFIVFEKEQVKALYQVCFDFNFETQERELNGAYEAMKFFDLKKTVIVTVNQSDVFTTEFGVVELMPLHKFLEKKP